jgi:hypothetical protein
MDAPWTLDEVPTATSNAATMYTERNISLSNPAHAVPVLSARKRVSKLVNSSRLTEGAGRDRQPFDDRLAVT